MAVGSMHVAAASLIGIEMLAVMIGYATVWPVGVPFAIIAIGIYAVVRLRLRNNGEDGAE